VEQRKRRCFRAPGQDRTSEDRDCLIGGTDQGAGVRYRANRALVVRRCRFIGMDVVRLDEAGEQHQQRTHNRKRRLTGAKLCRLLTILQKEN
jgi:hypothetical protein